MSRVTQSLGQSQLFVGPKIGHLASWDVMCLSCSFVPCKRLLNVDMNIYVYFSANSEPSRKLTLPKIDVLPPVKLRRVPPIPALVKTKTTSGAYLVHFFRSEHCTPRLQRKCVRNHGSADFTAVTITLGHH